MLHISIEESVDTVILHCAGRIVRGDETALLCAAIGQHGRDITVDLNQVDAIDAAGIGALISLHAAGIYLRLINPSKAIREVLRVTRLDSLFEINGDLRTRDPKEHGSEEHQGQDARLNSSSVPFLSPSVATAI